MFANLQAYKQRLRENDKKVDCFSIVLNRLIEKTGFRYADVARAIGVEQSTFHDWITGRRPHDKGKIGDLATFFNVSVEYILFGEKQDRDKAEEKLAIEEFENFMARQNISEQIDMFIDLSERDEKFLDIKNRFSNGDLKISEALNLVNKTLKEFGFEEYFKKDSEAV